MQTHNHKFNKKKFLAEMAKRGWQLDPNGWIIPEGRRIQQRESDWLASIVLSIECECPYHNKDEVCQGEKETKGSQNRSPDVGKTHDGSANTKQSG